MGYLRYLQPPRQALVGSRKYGGWKIATARAIGNGLRKLCSGDVRVCNCREPSDFVFSMCCMHVCE